MENTSILAAFERMWFHILAKLNEKSDIDHVQEVSKGGTGATDATMARTNLSVYSKTETDIAISTAIGDAIASSY